MQSFASITNIQLLGFATCVAALHIWIYQSLLGLQYQQGGHAFKLIKPKLTTNLCYLILLYSSEDIIECFLETVPRLTRKTDRQQILI